MGGCGTRWRHSSCWAALLLPLTLGEDATPAQRALREVQRGRVRRHGGLALDGLLRQRALAGARRRGPGDCPGQVELRAIVISREQGGSL